MIHGRDYTSPPEGWPRRASLMATRLWLLGLPAGASTLLALYGAAALLYRGALPFGPVVVGAVEIVIVTVVSPALALSCSAIAARADDAGTPVLSPGRIAPLRAALPAMGGGILVGAAYALGVGLLPQEAALAQLIRSQPAVMIGVPASITGSLILLDRLRLPRAHLTRADIAGAALDPGSQKALNPIQASLGFPLTFSLVGFHGLLVISWRPLSILAGLGALWIACFVRAVIVEMRTGRAAPDPVPEGVATSGTPRA